ncbi:hypothetical protein CEP53_010216 [Fusarium sp. AF-6]|nr:hypothetical protein CEP53_010216 [Fusarium sp. AF-6]
MFNCATASAKGSLHQTRPCTCRAEKSEGDPGLSCLCARAEAWDNKRERGMARCSGGSPVKPKVIVYIVSPPHASLTVHLY